MVGAPPAGLTAPVGAAPAARRIVGAGALVGAAPAARRGMVGAGAIAVDAALDPVTLDIDLNGLGDVDGAVGR